MTMANGNNTATWDEKWLDDMTARACAEVTDRLVGRLALLPALPKNGSYGSHIDSYNYAAGNTGSLELITISAVFPIQQGSLPCKEFVLNATAHAADRLATAEDAIVLLGKHAHGHLPKGVETTPDLEKMADLRGLFPAVPIEIPKDKSVVISILNGMNRLGKEGHNDRFIVILSSALHQEASTPLTTAGGQRAIEPILGRFRDQKLLPPSPVLPGRSGVILCLGGAQVEQVFTWDVHVERQLLQDSTQMFRVVEQFRLRVNDPAAIAVLE